jgi:hypothetical protein
VSSAPAKRSPQIVWKDYKLYGSARGDAELGITDALKHNSAVFSRAMKSQKIGHKPLVQKTTSPPDVKSAYLCVTVHSTLHVSLSRFRVHPSFSAVFDLAG